MRGKHLNSGIRGGLWEEEHLLRMGPAVWLFGWLVHRQTRERDGVGLVLGGSPLTYEIIRQDTGIAVRTLKRWMARLGRCGYIRITYVARKRMVIQIAKAKKFGPQQLRFPQNGPVFPQQVFFVSNSKGPLPAPYHHSKGPLVASLSRGPGAQPVVKSFTYRQCAPPHREKRPERQETNTSNQRSSRDPADVTILATPVEKLTAREQNLENPATWNRCGNRFATRDRRNESQVRPETSSKLIESAAQRSCQSSFADRKLRREVELQAELRVGLGPEVRRDSG